MNKAEEILDSGMRATGIYQLTNNAGCFSFIEDENGQKILHFREILRNIDSANSEYSDWKPVETIYQSAQIKGK